MKSKNPWLRASYAQVCMRISPRAQLLIIIDAVKNKNNVWVRL